VEELVSASYLPYAVRLWRWIGDVQTAGM